VEYYSETFGEWIPAKVMQKHPDGGITLDVKKNADPSRVRILGGQAGGRRLSSGKRRKYRNKIKRKTNQKTKRKKKTKRKN
jgi:hypothetical protein